MTTERPRRLRTSLAAVGITGVVAAGMAIPAMAQDATDEPTTTEEGTAGTDLRDRMADRRAERVEELAAALADELGLDVDTVAAALETVHAEMQAEREAERDARVQAWLDEQVEVGELTQEEADTLADLRDRDVFDGIGGRRHVHRHGGPGTWLDAPGDAGAESDAQTEATADTV